jgi:hypothetical protein
MSYLSTTIPLSYSTPPFPSLYWPIRAPPGSAQYLYSLADIWRFTLYWTLITFGLVHSAAAAWAVLMQFHSAMTQRRVLRRKEGGKEMRKGDGNVEGSGSGVDANTNTRTSTRTSVSSDRPTSPQLSTSTFTHHAHLPQPLLVSSSPVLSTLGWVWIIPVVYLTVGGIEALLSGSLVGLIVGAVYNAGYFKMSTWMPFLWGLINCLVVILGSFRIQGGL